MRLNNKLLVLFFGLSFILNMSVLSCNTKAEIPYVAPYAGGDNPWDAYAVTFKLVTRLLVL